MSFSVFFFAHSHASFVALQTPSYCLAARIPFFSLFFALYTHCLQQDNIILCFYLSLVRANIKVATPKATSTTATGQQKLWKICTPWMVHKMALAGAYVRLYINVCIFYNETLFTTITTNAIHDEENWVSHKFTFHHVGPNGEKRTSNDIHNKLMNFQHFNHKNHLYLNWKWRENKLTAKIILAAIKMEQILVPK